MLFDQKVWELRVSLHGGVVQASPARLRLAVDEGVPREEGLANLDAAVLRRQVERRLALQVKDVHSAIVFEENLRKSRIGMYV